MNDRTVVVAVCDDDRGILELIGASAKTVFEKKGLSAEVLTFSSVAALRRRMETMYFDLLLLDVEMPGTDGIEFGVQLRKEHSDGPAIIYISKCENRVFEAFQARPVCFVRKYNFLEDLTVAIELFLRQREEDGAKKLRFTTRKGVVAVAPEDILYIESYRNTQTLHMKRGDDIELQSTMDALTEELKPHGFLRVHKAYIVNYVNVERFGRDGIIVGGQRVEVSRRRFSEISAEYMRLVRSNGGSVVTGYTGTSKGKAETGGQTEQDSTER